MPALFTNGFNVVDSIRAANIYPEKFTPHEEPFEDLLSATSCDQWNATEIFEVAALAREPLGSTVWAGRVPPSTQTAPRTWPMATSTTRRRRRRTRWRR